MRTGYFLLGFLLIGGISTAALGGENTAQVGVNMIAGITGGTVASFLAEKYR